MAKPKSVYLAVCLLVNVMLVCSGCGIAIAGNKNWALSLSPNSVTFGPQALNTTSAPQAMAVTNTGTGSVTISSISVCNAVFAFAAPALPLSLGPGQAFQISVTYTPTVAGSSSGTLSVFSNTLSSPNAVSLSGTTTTSAQLSVTPTALQFGNQLVGTTSSPQTVTLQNSGSANVAISGLSTSPSQFALASAPALPFTLVPGQTATVIITFTPTAEGTVMGALTVSSNAGSSPNSASLSGSGIQASTTTLAMTTTSLHVGYLQQPYAAVLNATGGVAPYTWSVSLGVLPAGLTLNASNGQISGTPTQSGSFSLTLQATDAALPTPGVASKSFTFTVASGTYDQYGGVTQLVCPNGPKAHFYTQKINGRWWLCTPAGNVFWLRGVYHVDASDSGADYQYITLYGPACTSALPPSALSPCSVVVEKYGDVSLTWGPQTVQRLKGWGFNGTAEDSSTYVQPTTTNSTWTTADHSNPQKMSFTAQVFPAHYSRNINSYANPVKNLVSPIKTTVYTGFRRASPDIWDPNFAQWLQKDLSDPSTIDYNWIHSPHSDYLIGLDVDDTDELQGFGAGPDFPTSTNGAPDSGTGNQQPHLGWIVLVTPPTQASGTDANGNPITYTDTTVYSKLELSNWLSARYGGNILSLNFVWGSSYTTFGSNGGWGTGTGLLDEDGTHPWVSTDPYRLTGATVAMQKDLDDFLFHQADKYFSIIKNALQVAAPGILFLGPTVLGTWGAPPRRQILQAAVPYLDVLGLPTIPTGCTSCTDNQQRIDFVAQYGGDKPWINWEGFFAQPDSYMSPYPAPFTSMPQSTTQALRGQQFQTMVTQLMNAKDTTTSTYHIVGYKWWELYDNRGERANWGLLTRRDNGYDGFEATTAAGKDSWGYPTGGEQANYGSFLDAVTNANLNVYKSLLGLL